MMLKRNCLAIIPFIALTICESNGVIQNKEEQTFTGNILSVAGKHVNYYNFIFFFFFSSYNVLQIECGI